MIKQECAFGSRWVLYFTERYLTLPLLFYLSICRYTSVHVTCLCYETIAVTKTSKLHIFKMRFLLVKIAFKPTHSPEFHRYFNGNHSVSSCFPLFSLHFQLPNLSSSKKKVEWIWTKNTIFFAERCPTQQFFQCYFFASDTLHQIPHEYFCDKTAKMNRSNVEWENEGKNQQ